MLSVFKDLEDGERSSSKTQQPIGSIISNARKAKDWSRSKLSEETGITESSLVRYELAGIEEEGQYPPSPKLALICIALEIEPMLALVGCLPPKLSGYFEDQNFHNKWDYIHPQMDWMEKEYTQAIKDNMLLKNFVELVLENLNEANLDKSEKWLVKEGKEIVKRHNDFEARMMQIGVFGIPMGAFFMPSDTTNQEGNSWIFNLSNTGVIDENNYSSGLLNRSLNYYAKRFKGLSEQYGNKIKE